MSRNLTTTWCAFCSYPEMKLLEEPCRKSAEVLGAYFDEYARVEFADAECPACGAEYLAWCGGVHIYGDDEDGAGPGLMFADKVNKHNVPGYSDLSYRSTFDDEPGDRDRPRRPARKVWVSEGGEILAEMPDKE